MRPDFPPGPMHEQSRQGIETSRRGLLALVAVAPLTVFALGGRAQAQVAACFDAEALPAGQKSLRKSLNFKTLSADPKKACGSCNFYAATSGNCGKCQIFSGGPVLATSVCDAWAAKA